MRLRELKMTAFGPYGRTETIDFRKIEDRGFFLISGPTGAGKSSILDGICVALYGQTSGADRDAERMRSDLAETTTVTELSLEFALRDKVYRVTRRPRHMRPKKRGGDALVEEPAKASLELLDGDGKPRAVIAEKPHAVDEEIRRLLGLDIDQFRQVVVLPQGKFQKLLLATGTEREAILEVLFGTEIYRRIQEVLKVRAKGLQQECQDAEKERTHYLTQVECDSVEQLLEIVATEQARLGALREEKKRLGDRETQTIKTLADGRAVAEKLRELDRSVQAIEGLDKKSVEIEERKATLGTARAAAGLLDVEKHAAMRDAEAAKASDAAARSERSASESTARCAAARAAFERESARAVERDDAKRRAQDLAAMLARLEELERATRVLEVARRSRSAAVALRDRARHALDENIKSAEADRKERERLGEIAATTKAVAEQLKDARQRLEWASQLDSKRKELAAAKKELRGASNGRTAVLAEKEKAVAESADAERRWVDGQAARLARMLERGQPCPVCGSKDHPRPAKPSVRSVSDETLEELKQRVKDFEIKEKRAALEEKEAEKRAERLSAVVSGLEANLGDEHREPVGSIRKRVDAIEMQQAAGEKARSELVQLEKRIADLELLRPELQRRFETAGSEVELAEKSHGAAEATVAERARGIPEEFRDRLVLDGESNAAAKRASDLVAAFETARNTLDSAEKALAACRSAAQAASNAAAEARQAAEEARSDLLRRIDEAGFPSVAEYERAKKTEQQMRQLEKEIKEYEEARSAARDRVRRAREAAQGLVSPDLDALSNEADAARARVQEATREEKGIEDRIAFLGKGEEGARKAEVRRKQMEEQFAMVGALADAASGKNRRNLSFQRYVQQTLLDGVLVMANRRLDLMTAGRYRLRRCEEDPSGRSAGGLDLEVVDAFTHKARRVSTLSGGESFLAALAIALGLADEVMSRAGGIQLETVFVDEGFGSLDSEALDLAIRTLIDLQEGGRTVGIISHVPELRERIDLRLEVVPSPTGSTTRFVSG
ncbi:MAG: SMC family ATPase [Acidobacteriota bacterium]